jgi:glycosyltransferase involved in cell wall biosynthesis
MSISVLHVISTLRRHGAARQLALLAAGLPAERFESRVVVLGRTGPVAEALEASSVAVDALDRRWTFDPLAVWRLGRVVRRIRPAVVHAWDPDANLYACLAARRGRVPWIASLLRLEARKDRFDPAAWRWAVRRAERVVVNSDAVGKLAASRGLPPERLLVIPAAAPSPAAGGMTRRQLLIELGLPEEARLLAVVGTLELHKRIPDAIWAADLLKVIRGDAHLLVVGDGPQRQRLERFRDLVLIRDKVHFLGERGDVDVILPHVDVLLSPGEDERHPTAVLEAMAAGVPVVAADGPAMRELVEPDQTGYLVRAGDRAGLARWANVLLDDAAAARRLGEAARCRAAERFRLDVMLDRHAALYYELRRRNSP